MSNRLPVLAAAIQAAHAESLAASVTAAAKALEAGRALVEAKSLVRHGGWLPFLAEAGIHERTAQRLMTLAESDLKSDTVSDLGGVTSALRFLRRRHEIVALLAEAAKALADAERFDAGLARLEEACVGFEELAAMFPPDSALGAPRKAPLFNGVLGILTEART